MIPTNTSRLVRMLVRGFPRDTALTNLRTGRRTVVETHLVKQGRDGTGEAVPQLRSRSRGRIGPCPATRRRAHDVDGMIRLEVWPYGFTRHENRDRASLPYDRRFTRDKGRSAAGRRSGISTFFTRSLRPSCRRQVERNPRQSSSRISARRRTCIRASCRCLLSLTSRASKSD